MKPEEFKYIERMMKRDLTIGLILAIVSIVAAAFIVFGSPVCAKAETYFTPRYFQKVSRTLYVGKHCLCGVHTLVGEYYGVRQPLIVYQSTCDGSYVEYRNSIKAGRGRVTRFVYSYTGSVCYRFALVSPEGRKVNVGYVKGR
jgi:hypothetical protein